MYPIWAEAGTASANMARQVIAPAAKRFILRSFGALAPCQTVETIESLSFLITTIYIDL
jgi:hypothetical protein